MRFIILAPILCLLAIVAAYPIQQVRSLDVYPRTFLQTKEPAGGLTQREVTQKIYRRSRSRWFSPPTPPPLPQVTFNYGVNATETTPGLDEAKKRAMRKMEWRLLIPPYGTTRVMSRSIT